MASSSSSSSSSSYFNLGIVLLALSSAVTLVQSASNLDAPSPAVDCSSLVLTMADCLSFVSNGSTVDKPEGTCCSGLKTVLKTDAECLCEAFRSSAQLGVVLNVSKAMTLPSACKVSAASATKCALSVTPAAAPGAPVSSPIASAPSKSEGASEVAVAPAPRNSAADASPVLAKSAGVAAAAVVAAASWIFI